MSPDLAQQSQCRCTLHMETVGVTLSLLLEVVFIICVALYS